ncbi:hypothetical protein [Kribbella sp. DT2]|uniref:hypothetical protein n=1 Tax=Kribbella sp. DT2 TaxID=3393427 RepID=UPI003CF5863A
MSNQAAFKVEYDHIAELYLGGRVAWVWAVHEVAAVVIASGNADEAFEQPLGGLWEADLELELRRSEPWGRTDEEFAEVVRVACVAQLQW